VSDPEKIELSICIATFNRAKFIGETLDSLLPQLCRGVELVILDGGSSDQTEQIVGDYAARSPRIRYIRQTTNNGVDRDFDRAVELASG
jgi:abequosyltransferase